jgi:hypothetical protein
MDLGRIERHEIVEDSRKRHDRGDGRFFQQRGRGRIVVVIEPERAALFLRGGGTRGNQCDAKQHHERGV